MKTDPLKIIFHQDKEPVHLAMENREFHYEVQQHPILQI